MILVVGGGVFGLTAALELRARGRDVRLCDPGTLPHPLAESTDLSKVVRCDYGADLLYTELGERSLAGWRRWNERAPLYHETGVTFLASAPLQPGGFEYESFALLSARGHRIERLGATEIPRRFPAYRPGALVDGYVHAEGGWARASSTITHLAARARAAGVEVVENCAVTELVDDGVMIGDEHVRADAVIVCAGSWTPRLVPELASSLRPIGQPVFHFQPAEPARFDASVFPVFGGDISRTGYYGFPLTDGIVKIANHGTGREITTGRESVDVTAAEREAVRAFVRDVFPALADAPITHTRCCVYGDALDGHFIIAPHPERPHLVVAAGGSGHAFKFAPVLGELIANAVDGQVIERFRWRTMSPTRGDAARA